MKISAYLKAAATKKVPRPKGKAGKVKAPMTKPSKELVIVDNPNPKAPGMIKIDGRVWKGNVYPAKSGRRKTIWIIEQRFKVGDIIEHPDRWGSRKQSVIIGVKFKKQAYFTTKGVKYILKMKYADKETWVLDYAYDAPRTPDLKLVGKASKEDLTEESKGLLGSQLKKKVDAGDLSIGMEVKYMKTYGRGHYKSESSLLGRIVDFNFKSGWVKVTPLDANLLFDKPSWVKHVYDPSGKYLLYKL